MMRRGIIAFGLLLLVGSGVTAADTLSFGVVPQQSATKLARIWGPALQYLSETSGIDVRFHTAPSIPEFEERLRHGIYDVAYMNPLHYVAFHERPGYRAFARERDKRLTGILITKKGQGIETLSALSGRTLAFPSPNAFAATVLTQGELRRQGVLFEPRYVQSHDSVYRNVAKGLFPAGGGVVRTFNAIAPDIRNQLTIFHRTASVTPHAFAAHPRVDEATVNTLRQAMAAMIETESGRAVLKQLNLGAIAAATDSDWNDIREMKLQEVEHLLKE